MLSHRRRHVSPTLFLVLIAALILIPLWRVESERGGLRSTAVAAPQTPTFSLPGGYYTEAPLSLALQPPQPDLPLLYTLDGSEPGPANGFPYSQPIHLDATAPQVVIVRARAVTADGSFGPIATASYFLDVPASLPLISLVIDPDDFSGSERGIYANPEMRGREWERPAHITFLEPDRQTGFESGVGLRVHGLRTRLLAKKGLRLYFRDEYGNGRLDYPLFPDSELTSFKQLVLHNGGQDMAAKDEPTFRNWTLLRNSLTTQLADPLHVDAARSRPVLLFINGQPWGIYQLRERIDDDFLADHYGIEEADLLDTPEGTEYDDDVKSGSRDHWDALMDFVEANDLREPANHDFVAAQVDLDNFIDYTLLQIYTSNEDWPFHNVTQYRNREAGGKWQWLLWDNDLALSYHPADSLDRNMVAETIAETHPLATPRYTLLLRRLLANPDFYNRFLVRQAILLETVFDPEQVLPLIEALAAEMEPDIDYEIARWQIDRTNWWDNVESLRQFARQRPDYVRQHTQETFNLAGLAGLQLNGPVSGEGSLVVADMPLTLPWHGRFFKETTVPITAVPGPGFQFSGWAEGGIDNPFLWSVEEPLTLTPIFEPLLENAPRPGDITLSDYSEIGGEQWLTLRLNRTLDLRGWRITDNDSKTATDEGSLIFSDDEGFSAVSSGTLIRIHTNCHLLPGECPPDDVDGRDGEINLYTSNAALDVERDPWFHLSPNDNIVILAPGETDEFADDIEIAFTRIGQSGNR
jgi:hypothetical protein